MTNEGHNEGCRGCKEFGLYTCVGLKIVKGITLTCPCQVCIIKMMCDKACEEFRDYNDLTDDNLKNKGFSNV